LLKLKRVYLKKAANGKEKNKVFLSPLDGGKLNQESALFIWALTTWMLTATVIWKMAFNIILRLSPVLLYPTYSLDHDILFLSFV